MQIFTKKNYLDKKLFLCDIDGVLTTGKKTYGLDGMPFAKEFFDKDFTALKQIKAAGFEIIFVSSDLTINQKVAINRNYPFLFSRGRSKLEVVNENLKISDYDIIFVCGDDLFDIPILEIATHRICPHDANFIVKDLCNRESDFISVKNGGDGVIQDIVRYYYENFFSSVTLDDIEKLDMAEKF